MPATVTTETVHDGPRRVLYSADRLVRCSWMPPRAPHWASYISLQWRHDAATDDWHDECERTASVYDTEDENAIVEIAQSVMDGFTRQHRLDRYYEMGHVGPAVIKWELVTTPGVITVELAYRGPWALLTAAQARAAVAYLRDPDPDPARGWYVTGMLALSVGWHLPGYGLADIGGLLVPIDAEEWAGVLAEGAAAIEAASSGA